MYIILNVSFKCLCRKRELRARGNQGRYTGRVATWNSAKWRSVQWWGGGWELDSLVVVKILAPSESLFPIRSYPAGGVGWRSRRRGKNPRTFVEKGTRQGDVWASGHRMRRLQMACGIALSVHATCSSMSTGWALFLFLLVFNTEKKILRTHYNCTYL